MPTIKLLSVIEATTVTGPARVLLEFYRSAAATPTGEPEMGGDTTPRVAASIVTFHRAGDKNDRQSADGQADRAPNHFVATARAAGLHVDVIDERFRFDTSVLPALSQIVDRFQPDIIESHHVKSHFLIRKSGLWRQRPWIAYHHGYTTTDLKMHLYNQLDRWSLRAAHGIITVSNAAARDLARRGVPATKIHALHNAIDPDWYAPVTPRSVAALRAQLGMDAAERVILSVGRLSHEKAQADLLAAFAHLRQMQPGLKIRLVLVGDGPERPAIEQLATALGVREGVVLVGQVEDVRPYYGLATVMALPSLTEGSPIALLEAMVARVPTVATNVGGIPEIVQDGESALLVPARASHAMAHALGKLLLDTKLAQQLATRAHEVVVTRHSPVANTRVRLAIYQGLLER